ncbi:hypothetical protein GWI33_003539 [Rhynchophorus ferrugineus]|uniref:Uncharacterized protein n=1 Tax=Rhynchophorus ferrugineus TaxID=354439 RepID=A0A834HKG5_RHYFE|nr:hypothetical protein GWI33_003541 [Rhynchophorus ferrugineus]KAF7263172.1 hypothetical protein GWI33_003539 [Rhynchophorus ferrugineus]
MDFLPTPSSHLFFVCALNVEPIRPSENRTINRVPVKRRSGRNDDPLFRRGRKQTILGTHHRKRTATVSGWPPSFRQRLQPTTVPKPIIRSGEQIFSDRMGSETPKVSFYLCHRVLGDDAEPSTPTAEHLNVRKSYLSF